MRVLITGGSGFIGRNVAAKLMALGHSVVTLDVSERSAGAERHIAGSILDRGLLMDAMKGIDAVVHMAAVTSPPEFEDVLGNGYEVNVMGTYNVLVAAAANGVRRAVLASSSSVYGNIGRPASEHDLPSSYENLYPVTKLVNEITARVFKRHGVEAVCLRYFNTYGYGEWTKGNAASVIWKFAEEMASGRSPVIYGDGTQRRDFIYVEDAARATVLALERGEPGEAYNVGTGSSYSFNEVFAVLKEELGFNVEPVYVKNPLKSYQTFTQADITKAKAELGFEPAYDLRSGIRRVVELIREKGLRGI